MKRQTAGPKLWVSLLACFLSAIHILPLSLHIGADAATALKFRRINSTLFHTRLQPQASIGVARRLPSPWAAKLVALRNSRTRADEEVTTTEALTTTQTSEGDETETPTLDANVTVANDDSFRKRSQQQDPQQDDSPQRSVVWPARSRGAAASRRLRLPSPTTPAPIVLLKLLQPKPTRPAIYSLDGFVPKPSIQRVVSTEPPPHFQAKNLQLLGSAPRRRKAHRYSKVEEADDAEEEFYLDQETDGRRRKRKNKKKRKNLVSRYTAFARKGVPGEDFPVYTYIPQTEFDCGLQPGLYADPFTDCQVWHMCPGGNLSPRHSFLCPNGTIFNQKKRICDWWYNVDCHKHSRRIRSPHHDSPLAE